MKPTDTDAARQPARSRRAAKSAADLDNAGGMLLLTMSLGVTGLAIAVYRERPQSWASVDAAQIAEALLRPAHDPLAAAAAAVPSPTRTLPTAATLPASEPQAGPPVQEAALEPLPPPQAAPPSGAVLAPPARGRGDPTGSNMAPLSARPPLFA